MPVMQLTRTSVDGQSPVAGSLQPGQLAVEMGMPTRLWVGVPTVLDPAMQKKLFDSAAGYLLTTGGTMTGTITLMPGAELIGITPAVGSNQTGGDVVITAGTGDGARMGGAVNITSGDSPNNLGPYVNILGGRGLSSGGFVSITGGQSLTSIGTPGSVLISGAAALAGSTVYPGGGVSIVGGSGNDIGGGTVFLQGGGSANAPGGDVHLRGGTGGSSSRNGNVILETAMTGAGASGNIIFDTLPAALDDAAAATAGVPVKGLYQNAGAVRVRLV